MAEMYSNEESAYQDDDCSLEKEDQDQPIICMRSNCEEDITCEASSNIDDPNDVSLVASVSQVIPKSYSLAIRKLCEKNCESADEAYELLLDYIENIYPKVVECDKFEKLSKQLENKLARKINELNEMTTKFQKLKVVVGKGDTISAESLNKQNAKSKTIIANLELKTSQLQSSLNEALNMFNVKDSQNCELCQTITTLKSQIEKLETELSNRLKDKNDVCMIASVSPRCEANNVLDDRVRMLELENSNLNEIIKKSTSSQERLNCLVGKLSKNSNGQGLGFQSSIFKTNPKKVKMNKFVNFLSNSSNSHFSDIECLNAKTNVVCHYCTQRGHVSHDCLAKLYPRKFSWIPKICANMLWNQDLVTNRCIFCRYIY